MKKTSIALVGLALIFGGTFPAVAADYPSKPLEIVAPAGVGGGWDGIARAVNITLEKEGLYPQPMTVSNKAGGGGAVGFAYIRMRENNDYELVVFSPPLIIKTIDATLQGDYRKLTPLAKLISDYQIFVVKADSPFKTLADLIAALKKDPSSAKYSGGSAPFSIDHIAFLKVARAAGIDPSKLVYVALSGGGEAMTTLLGGKVSFMSTGTGEVLDQLAAGTIRILGITSERRLGGVLKDIPTVKEQGIPVTYEVWRGIFGAPGMSNGGFGLLCG